MAMYMQGWVLTMVLSKGIFLYWGKNQKEKIKMETGFEKLSRLRDKKGSSLIFGADPSNIKTLDLVAPYVVGVKPNLAFYEATESERKRMMELMQHARSKGLVTILDAKRGDILDTQKKWAEADIKNFNPDIVTLHSFSGQDAVQPYLDLDPQICAYIMGAMSNQSAQIQNLVTVEGLRVYQHIALDAHEWGNGRVGLVVGSTQSKAASDIRSIEQARVPGNEPLQFLSPGFGKQGGSLEFVSIAGQSAVYPISSGLTSEKHLKGKTPAEAAKQWRDDINAELGL